MDGYKTLGFQESIYGEFLARLRENPRLVASCLVAGLGERQNQDHSQGVVHTVFTSLYGNCIMQEDESYLLQVRAPNRVWCQQLKTIQLRLKYIESPIVVNMFFFWVKF